MPSEPLPKRPPVEYQPPNLQPDGSSRDAIIEAAREYDRQQQRIIDLETLLHRSHAEVQAAAHQIGELKLALAEERNHVASYKAERDEAVQDRANVVAILANIDAIVERGIRDGDIPRKGKRNGGRSVGAVVYDAVVSGAASPSIGHGGGSDPLAERLPDEKGS